jgi:O-antigen/teichoic acid export membrane protein
MLRRVAVVAVPLVALLVLLAPVVLSLYGSDYPAEGTDLLRIAVIALLPRALLVVWTSAERVRRRLGRILAVQAGLSALVLGLSWWLVPVVGIVGVGVAYLLAQLLGTAAVLPTLRRLIGRPVTKDATGPSTPADPSTHPLRKDVSR